MNKKSKEDTSSFEILFYEKILKETPDFIEALIALGDLYTNKGFYKKGLEIDKRLSILRPRDPIIFYNLACSYSLLKDISKAFSAIQLAIKYGYDDFDYLQQDSDLETLRRSERFQKFFCKIKNNV